MKLLKSRLNDSIGININSITFKSLLRSLRVLPELKIIEAKQHINDEAYATFIYKNIEFKLDTPLSDYWIDKPKNCPSEVFEEIIHHLENFKIKWWQKIF